MILYTIGHSNLPAEVFLELLQRNGIEVLVDCRSWPYSGYNPQFNREALEHFVEEAGIRYRFAGHQLGGRPRHRSVRPPGGVPDYDRIAAGEPYRRGIEALLQLAAQSRVAILCSEANPMVCHREKLIARTLRQRGVEIRHIVWYHHAGSDGQLTLWERSAEGAVLARPEQRGALLMWLYLGLGAWEYIPAGELS